MRAVVVAIVSCAALLGQKPGADPRHPLFGKGPVPRLELLLGEADAAGLRAAPRTYVRATLRENGQRTYGDVAVKIKGAGGSTRDFDDKPALTLDVDRFAKGQTVHGLVRFHLNNSVQDESYLLELLGSDTFRAVGLAAPRVGHARVWINGRDVGLYVVKEGFDRAFLERWFPPGSGALFDGGFCQDIDADLEKDEGKPKDDRADLERLRAACREPDPARRWPLLSGALDVEGFVTFVALEMMTGHWDGYALNHNNYRLYFDPASRRAHFLCHGMDQIFYDPEASVLEPPGAIVAGQVMLNPKWRARFRERIRELLPLFSYERLEQRVDEAMVRLGPAVASMGTRAAADHSQRVRELKKRLELRAKRLREQASLPDPAPLRVGKSAVGLADWHTNSECEDAQLLRDKDAGTLFYVVRSGPSGICVASWRKRVMLEKGRYRLHATVKVDDFAPLPDGAPSGADLRIAGAEPAPRVTGGRESQALAFEFTIAEAVQFVELVAEYRSSRGEARFDAASLRLARAKE
jgi:hypothetical protein